VERVEITANVLPSGLHRGELELKPSALRRRGVKEPSIGTNQMEDSRWFFFWLTMVRT
jgi:hypothetical protein